MIITPHQEKYIPHVAFWLFMAFVFGGFVTIFQDVLLPFVLGLAVAYFLNPFVNRLCTLGCSRRVAVIVILGLFLTVFLGILGAVSPIIYHEFLDFYEGLPVYIEKLWSLSAPFTKFIQAHVGAVDEQTIQNLFKNNADSASKAAQFILSKINSGGQAFLDLFSVMFLMPVVAYFMMKEWPFIVVWVSDLIPKHMEPTVLELFSQMDHKISAFVRGQISVAAVLALGYAVALTLVGLKYGFVIGIGAGLLSVIPMVGSVVGLLVGVVMAWLQVSSIDFIAIVLAVFVLGQLIEGNFLTPRLVGESVGLHPLWVFFALLAGGSLWGILGMFLAVPVAAIIGVLLGFGIRHYKKSIYYTHGKDAAS